MSDELIRREDVLKWVCDSDLDLAARKQIANAVRALPAVTVGGPCTWPSCGHTAKGQCQSPARILAALEPVAADPMSDPRVRALVQLGNHMASSIEGNYYLPRTATRWREALRQFGGEA